MEKFKLYIANDHNGLNLKLAIVDFFSKKGQKIVDLGCDTEDSVDYPDYAIKLANELRYEQNSLGILICGTGLGMSIVANRFSHITATLCTNHFMAERAKSHINANVLVFASQINNNIEVEEMLEIFLTTQFDGGRHILRLNKIP